MDEPLEVSGGSCSKGTWRQFFEATGNILSISKVFGSCTIFCKTFYRQIFLLRDMGAAYHRHCCHHGLCTPCRHLLQHGCLIIFFSYIYENEAHCTIHVISWKEKVIQVMEHKSNIQTRQISPKAWLIQGLSAFPRSTKFSSSLAFLTNVAKKTPCY